MTDTPEENKPTEELAVPEEQPTATVKTYKDWHLVSCGVWEISVAPDGLLMLPRHLSPDEVTDFCNCALAAAEVGRTVMAENREKTKEVDLENLPSGGRAIVTQGPPPPGAARLPIVPRAASPTPRPDYSTIGRPRRARSGGDPRQPRTTQPPNPPIPGARRNGRTPQTPSS